MTGAVALDDHCGSMVTILARAVLLATGGLGRIFLDTTNPDVATGDGVAMAWRAGARISDIEFVQFHPTALHVEGAPSFLLSEALRGEGAHLLNAQGERFMLNYHPMAELAPRDVVARAIVEEMRRDQARHVHLDLSGRGADFVKKRFPRIHATCLQFGLDLDLAPAPVHPAAHYAMGGVWTDLDGQTTLAGLWAAGEVACTGVHGANRLASNSLLEGVVFGALAARAMIPAVAPIDNRAVAPAPLETPMVKDREVRRLASEFCGIVRSGDGLRSVLAMLRCQPVERRRGLARPDVELANMHTVAQLIARCALARQESRGAHCRADYPEKSERFEKHSMIERFASEVFFE